MARHGDASRFDPAIFTPHFAPRSSPKVTAGAILPGPVRFPCTSGV